MSMPSTQFTLKEGSEVFSPKDNAELPRAGTALVNPSGKLVFVSLAGGIWGEKPSRWLHIASIEQASHYIKVPLAAPGETFWLDDHTIGQVVAKNDDTQELKAYTLVTVEGGPPTLCDDGPTVIGEIPVGAENFIYRIAAGKLVFSASVFDDFDLLKVKDHLKAWEDRGHGGLIYDAAPVRNIDVWRTPQRPTLFLVSLTKTATEWELGTSYQPLLKSAKHYVPSYPYGGSDEFDVSSNAVVYSTKDTQSSSQWLTRQDIYLAPLDGSSQIRALTSGLQGLTRSPHFNSRGDQVAWIEQASEGNEAAHSYVVICDLTTGSRKTVLSNWDRSVDSFEFSPNDDVLYLTAADQARGKIYAVSIASASASDPADVTSSSLAPCMLTSTGTATGLVALSHGRLLYMRSSFTTPKDVYVLDPHGSSLLEVRPTEHRITDFYKTFLDGKSLDKGTEMHWTVLERTVQGWVFTPPGFKKGDRKSWPALLMIHGGPSVNWQDMWFPRYNLNVYANQGYVVFAPNFTGSTSFGQDFVDALTGDWGGAPFDDMRAGWAEFLKQYPEVDETRTGAWGASWGGYAINWIAGHPEYKFHFKTLVNMCGIFDTTWFGWTSDQATLFKHAFGGFPWEKRTLELSDRFSPARYVHQWSTPMLLIHGGKDFSITDSEAVAAFNALQQRGVTSRLVMFPEENHYIMNPANSMKSYFEVFRWLDECLGADTK